VSVLARTMCVECWTHCMALPGGDKALDVTIPAESEAAKALETPARREAVGRYLSALLRGGGVPGKAMIVAAVEVREAVVSQVLAVWLRQHGNHQALAGLPDQSLPTWPGASSRP
jgi:hypothetical protein